MRRIDNDRERNRDRTLGDEKIYIDKFITNRSTGEKVPEYYVVKSLGKPEQRPLTLYHDSISNEAFTGRLSLKLKTLSSIFIGSGTVEITQDNQQYLTFARLNGEIVIPGSSLKGDIRQYAEALSLSCFDASCEGNALCPACRIFGSSKASLQGRVSFRDAKLLSGETKIITIAQRWEPRIKYDNGRKFYYHKDPQIKTQDKERIEVVEERGEFAFFVDFLNLEGWELGLLLLAMGVAPQKEFPLKIGGGKNRGLGLVKLELNLDKSFLFPPPKELCSSPSFSLILIKAEQISEWVQSYLSSLKEKEGILNKIIKKFREGKPDGQGQTYRRSS